MKEEWKKYIERNGKYYSLCFFFILSFNLYFIFLLSNTKKEYLFYLDFLIAVVIFLFLFIDYFKFKKMEMEKKKLLEYKDLIYKELPTFENQEIIEHDIQVLQKKLQEQFEANCDLEDYTMKFYHEVKIPLAAALLVNDKIIDAQVRLSMRENLERINQQLNTMLFGSKLQASFFDLQIKKISLQECIKTSIKNNQFFLIQKHFSIENYLGEKEHYVYTDKSWLVYIFDQLLNNAIKYRKEYPTIKIWIQEIEDGDSSQTIKKLFMEDNGVGIQKSDIRRIFEKGFIGSNYHNGKYKSTGMGLYLVAKIADKLKHEINVESEYGEYTRFCITFQDQRGYFHL